jgi:hypothetical protein
LEDLGFCVVIVTPEEKAALGDVQFACANYARMVQRPFAGETEPTEEQQVRR